MTTRIAIFGDEYGIPMLYKRIPLENICGIVVASIRPNSIDKVRNFLKDSNITLLIQPSKDSKRYSKFKKSMEELKPDLIWVNSYSMILREDILSIPYKSINIHGGLLPQQRGCNPLQWAIIKNESFVGVSLHEMSIGIDEGNIISKISTEINMYDTWKAVHLRLVSITETLIDKFIQHAISLQWKSIPQDNSQATYFPRRKPADGEFSWDDNAIDIFNLIRALIPPMPGAFYFNSNGEKIFENNYLSFSSVIYKKYDFLNKLSGFNKDIAYKFNLKKSGNLEILFTHGKKFFFRVYDIDYDNKTSIISYKYEIHEDWDICESHFFLISSFMRSLFIKECNQDKVAFCSTNKQSTLPTRTRQLIKQYLG